MPYLTTLRIRKCIIKEQNLENICQVLSHESCLVRELEIDFDKDINDAKI